MWNMRLNLHGKVRMELKCPVGVSNPHYVSLGVRKRNLPVSNLGDIEAVGSSLGFEAAKDYS